ncbi:hypothetical protein TeGR_g11181, partial [Tetraparma gracilis]
YNKIRGDLCIDDDFRVPPYEPWPEFLADYALGKAIGKLRMQGDMIMKHHPIKWQMLNQLDMYWLG